MPDWHWEPVTDDLLDMLPPAALAAVRQVAEELTVRESMIFLDGREFTGEPPGLRTVQRGQLMLVYLIRQLYFVIVELLVQVTADDRVVRSAALALEGSGLTAAEPAEARLSRVG